MKRGLTIWLGLAIAGHPGLGAAGDAVSTGTAWVVAPSTAVTNAHLVDGIDSLSVVTGEGVVLAASVLLRDEAQDLALLQFNAEGTRPTVLPVAVRPARLGATVFTVGFPRVDVMGRTPKLSLGVVSGTTGARDNPDRYQISVPIEPGNSGGPVVNLRGEVVGVVTSMLAVEDASGDVRAVPSVSYAAKADALTSLLERAGIPVTERADDSPDQDLEDLASEVSAAVLLVLGR